MVYFGIAYEVDNTKEDKRLEFGGSKGFGVRDESQRTVQKGGKKPQPSYFRVRSSESGSS